MPLPGSVPAFPYSACRGEQSTSIAYLFTPAVEKLVAGHPEKVTSMVLETESMGIASAWVNAAMIGSLIPKLTSVATRLQDMDAMGVDVQAISGSPNQTYYWADPDLSEQIVDLQNEEISALCSAHPYRSPSSKSARP